MDRPDHAPRKIDATFLRPRRPGTPAPPAGAAARPTHPPAWTGWLHLLRSLRQVPDLAHRDPASTAYMRYRASQSDGAPVLHLTGWVRLDDISPYLVCSVVRAEDPFFFSHRGIWWNRLLTAARAAVRERKQVRAVSTITQQLARNLFLHPERSMKRKLHEAILARRLEQVLTKERILELYLNVVEWGEGIWGVGSAAREHFSRAPAELDAFQAVVLASMLPAPRRPLRDRNGKRALATQKRVTIALYGSGIVSRDEVEELKGRILQLERAIEEGVPAGAVLRASTERPMTLTLEGRPDISVRALVSSHCGIERSRRLAPVLQEARRQRRTPELPLWWTGDPAPAPAQHAAA